MNQSQYAARHGVSPKTVTKWKERGWLVFAGDEVDVKASDANVKRYRTKAAEVVTQSAEGKGKGKATELQDALHEIIVEALEELTRDGVAR